MSTSLLQTKIWADFKSRFGWRQIPDLNFSLLKRHLSLGQNFLYAPELTLTEDLKDIIEATKTAGAKNNSIFARLEFLDEYSEDLVKKLEKLGLTRAFESVQPEWRQWVDLTKTEDEILAQMKPKGRYNIKVAQKHEVTITSETGPTSFLKLTKETAARDGFSIRNDSYYIDLIKTLTENNLGELLVARYQNEPLAAAIISYYEDFSLYLYGASSNNHREVMAPYLMHWVAIQHAKTKGCKIYDLLAVAPNPEDQDLTDLDKKYITKYAGLTRFKTQFGGRTVRTLGCWDIPISSIKYTAFKTLELMRKS